VRGGRLLFLFGLGLLLAGCSLAGDVTPPPDLATAQAGEPLVLSSPAAPAVNLPAGAPDMADGEALYAQHCAACHGNDGLGHGPQAASLPNPPAALADPALARVASPAAWYEIVTNGRLDKFMPGFSSLTDQQRWDVVAYALGLSVAPGELDRAASLFISQCAPCHGTEGSGGAKGPALNSAQALAEKSAADLLNIISNGGPTEMPGFAGSMSEADRWALAAYIRDLGFGQEGGATASQEVIATPASDGVISGQVMDGTAGAGLPAPLQVTLHGFDSDTEVVTETTTTAADGTFVFDHLELVNGRIFGLTTAYQGVTYYSQGTHLTAGQGHVDLPLTVYEISNDASRVTVDRLHMVFDFPSPGLMRVVELWVVSNSGDHTYAAGDGSGLTTVTLPQNASNLGFETGTMGQDYSPTGGGFIDREPVRPGSGSSQLIFSFELPYDRKLTFEQPVAYPVSAVVALMPENGPKIGGSGVQDLGLLQVTGASLHNYSLGPLPAGSVVSLSISGKGSPVGGLSSALSPANLAIGLGALGIALVSIGLWWYRPRRVKDHGAGGFAPAAAHGVAQDLVHEIADLDDAFEAGQIEEEIYRSRRRELKDRALKQMREAHD
jgi:mono/diheme cytochrome c family protein